MGTYAGVDYNSPYLTVNSVVSYPLPLQRERGAVGNLSYWLSSAHLFFFVYFFGGLVCVGHSFAYVAHL